MHSALGTACLLAFCLVSAADQLQPSFYHNTDEILEFFRTTAQRLPQRARYETIPDPESNFNLPVITITNFSSGNTNKETILITAGEHARELITSEVTYWLGVLLSGRGQDFDELTDWAALQPVQAAAWKTGATKTTLAEWAESLLHNIEFKILPVVNVPGRKAAETGDTCQRKTLSGVDLNRNWGFAWKQTAKAHEEYGGETPFSEPESRIVRLVAEGAQARASVNLHAGEWALYIPWDSQKSVAPGLPADIDELLEKLNTHCECMSGPAGKVAGYLAYGTSMDYLFNDLNVQYPLTFEIYGPDGLGKLAKGGHPRRLQQDQDSGQQLKEHTEGAGGREEVVETQAQRCLRDYNPLGLEDYQDVVARWLGALLVLAAHLAASPTEASTAMRDAGQSQLPLPPLKPTKQDLARMGKTAVEEHQHPEIFVRDARSMSDQLAARTVTPPLPVTSANKSLPHDRAALEKQDLQHPRFGESKDHVLHRAESRGRKDRAYFLQQDRPVHRRSALEMFLGGWSFWSLAGVLGLVACVVAVWGWNGGSLRPRSRRRGAMAQRRPQRHQM
ncbi:hypothetical protein WJX73_006850 [Symbiochloris irregularis]|uniref:Peptidase M14 domain-containing protein n=1 Tax=Symbiochloris irregularis TaxID=706552 RepID=A0AAW1PCH2_9CHLO